MLVKAFSFTRYSSKHSALCHFFILLMSVSSASRAADFVNPFVLKSMNGVLNLLVVARASPIYNLQNPPLGINPTGWVFDVCYRPTDGSDTCPPGSNAVNTPGGLYGGNWFQLNPGDTINIHFVNKLPLNTNGTIEPWPGFSYLKLNPTNLHVHGMLVSPRVPSPSDPTYGDYVLVYTFNSANGPVVPGPHLHADIRYDYTDYSIKIPASHPAGQYWIHPHVHGISRNQIGSGMSNLITLGSVNNYVTIPSVADPSAITDYLMLRDIQILPNGLQSYLGASNFCSPLSPNNGFCLGQDTSSIGGPDYRGGTWYHTINGLQYPKISVSDQAIFAITNASADRTYSLNLWDADNQCKLLFQIIAVDGVSVNIPENATPEQIAKSTAGGRFVPVPCPEGLPPPLSGAMPVCASNLDLFPSSRAEVLVAYRDCTGRLATVPSQGALATFRTDNYATGTTGTIWPAINLAKVTFAPGGKGSNALITGEATQVLKSSEIAKELQDENQQNTPNAACKPLAPGHMRRIFFGSPQNNSAGYGLAYEELDENGQVVAGTMATQINQFDVMNPFVCLPLGPNNTTTRERWQLVNLSQEMHNFHIHQVKFQLLGMDSIFGEFVPAGSKEGLLMDSIPLPSAFGACGNNPPVDNSNPIDDYRQGICRAQAVTVEIPFSIAGKFVYHCHIIFHEDQGMMAFISVVPYA